MQNIILLHGALGTYNDLNALSEALKKLDFRVFSFNFSGHGDQAFVPKFGIEQFSNELEHFIIKNKIEGSSVFGYSMGGFVALNMVAQKPNLIKKIITLGTKFDWNAESLAKELRSLDADFLKQKAPAFAKLLETKHGENWIKLLTKTADLMKEIVARDFLSYSILAKISTPTLIGRGDRDQMVSLEETISVFNTLPDASLFVLPKTKHQIESASTELLSQLIKKFSEEV